MLREDVVAACECEAFHIYAVDTIYEALKLLTGAPSGVRVHGHYPKGTLLCSAVARAEAYWRTPCRARNLSGRSRQL